MSYTGRCMHIDLSEGTHRIEETDRDLLGSYIGGKGLGFALLEKLAPSPDPLGPDNPLIFVNGPFTGTPVQTSARTCLVTRSPLTGSILDSHCGGYFGPRLKAAGYDYLVITGCADHPVYVVINGESVLIRDAADLWGKGTFDVTDILLSRHAGKNPRVACIGPAGENLSRIACICTDKWRQYGRGGVGAVMGSKRLKALVLDGDFPIRYSDRARFMQLNRELTRDIMNHDGVKFRRRKGTMKCIRSGQEYEFLPTRNWQEVTFEGFEGISSETFRRELGWKDVGCYSCGIQCSKLARWDGYELEGPEYETAAFLGSGCEVGDARSVALANWICDDLGMDTISAGGTCGFAMECFEKGLLEDWDGLDLRWGDAAAQQELLRRMAARRGVGEVFADGTRAAARRIGKGSETFAVNVFGMELSGVNPKGCLTMGVVLSVADFASHTRLWLTEQESGPDFKQEDIPRAVADGLDDVNARNCLIACDFVPFGLDRLAPVLNAMTGFDFTAESLHDLGTRLTHLARRYNLRNGRTHEDDVLPERFFQEKSLAGFMRGRKLEKTFFKSIIQEYYALRGWNERGEPTPATLERFGLS